VENLTPQDVALLKQALGTLSKSSASAELWQIVSAVATIATIIASYVARVAHLSRVKLKEAQDEQIKGLEGRLEDRKAELARMIEVHEAMRASLENQRREQLAETRSTATMLADALHRSTEAQNAVAEMGNETAQAIEAMHRDLVNDLKERASRRNP